MKRLFISLCAVLWLMGISGTAGANLIQNGDFETGDLTGWDSWGKAVAGTVTSVNYYGSLGLETNSGLSGIGQTVTLSPGAVAVTVSFDYIFDEFDEALSYTDFFTSHFSFLVPGQSPQVITNLSLETTSNGIIHFSTTYGIPNLPGWLGEARITFNLYEDKGLLLDQTRSWVSLDNVVIEEVLVPVPGALGLFGSGLIAILGLRKLRRK